MAATGWFPVTDPRVVTVWERLLDREVRVKDPLFDDKNGFASDKNGSLITIKDELSKGPGARIRTKLKYQLEGAGRAGDQTLKGYGEFYKTAVFDVYVDTIRHYVETPSPIMAQWVTEDTMEEGRDGLADWFSTRFSFGAHLHACGIALITNPVYTLNNEVQALNADYIIRPNSKTAGNLNSNDQMTVDVVSEVVMRCKLARPKIRPAKTPWGDRYVMFLSPEQVNDLRKSDGEWFGLMKAALQGGRIDDNPIWSNALGQYNGVVFMESDLIPPGLNSGETAFLDKTRRAWVGGASALLMGFGRGFAPPGYDLNRFRWDRESEDFGHQQQIAATTIVGLARSRYQKPGDSAAKESGVIVVETYADHKATGSDVYSMWLDAGGTLV